MWSYVIWGPSLTETSLCGAWLCTVHIRSWSCLCSVGICAKVESAGPFWTQLQRESVHAYKILSQNYGQILFTVQSGALHYPLTKRIGLCVYSTCCRYHMSAMLHTLSIFAVLFHAVIQCDFILICPTNFCDRTYPDGSHIHQLHCVHFNKGNTSMWSL
jgi:hypothetical protein